MKYCLDISTFLALIELVICQDYFEDRRRGVVF